MTGKTKSIGRIVLQWWRGALRPETETGDVRGFRARLRRADHPFEALADRRVIALHEALDGRVDPLTLAALVQVLAGVEAYEAPRIARAFGAGDPPRLSASRFQRLIRATDRTELATGLRRALPLIGNTCNVAALAEDIVYWGETVRIRWCFDYYGKPAPDEATSAPGSTAPEMEETA